MLESLHCKSLGAGHEQCNWRAEKGKNPPLYLSSFSWQRRRKLAVGLHSMPCSADHAGSCSPLKPWGWHQLRVVTAAGVWPVKMQLNISVLAKVLKLGVFAAYESCLQVGIVSGSSQQEGGWDLSGGFLSAWGKEAGLVLQGRGLLGAWSAEGGGMVGWQQAIHRGCHWVLCCVDLQASPLCSISSI